MFHTHRSNRLEILADRLTELLRRPLRSPLAGEVEMCIRDRPEDEPELKDLIRRMPPEDVRMRFFQPIRCV